MMNTHIGYIFLGLLTCGWILSTNPNAGLICFVDWVRF